MCRSFVHVLVIAACLAMARAPAAAAPFDLAGPVVELTVTRGKATLPVAEVPNLQVGDRLWIRADLPANAAAEYLMVAAFLSGSTSPPPQSWFFPCKTWSERCGREGLKVTVPAGATQALVFFAPRTHGDLSTLIDTVRGRPGVFVRTSQDLNQAALDRSRLEAYVLQMRHLADADPAGIRDAAPLLSRSLAIKVDERCMERMPALQAPCLTQGGENLILNDGHSASLVQALTSGPASDLALEASYTPKLGSGYYSPYVASVLDIARLLDSFNTAQYQYIPALALARTDRLALLLNTAPSFHDPKSVLVVALPAVDQPQLPPLHAVNAKDSFCAGRGNLVLPVEGAPLVFSTAFAHDMQLQVRTADGGSVELPAHADATRGGYVIDTHGFEPRTLGETSEALLHGAWGFNPYEGPRFHLSNARTQGWTIAAEDADSVIVGRLSTVHLHAEDSTCLERVMLRDPAGKEQRIDWKLSKPGELELALPLQDSPPGTLTLMLEQYGGVPAQSLSLQGFADTGHFTGFSLHAGDAQGILRGGRLDEVASLRLNDAEFLPGELMTRHGADELPMVAGEAQKQALGALQPGRTLTARITLKNGRGVKLPVTVEPPRPRVAMLGLHVESAASSSSGIALAGNSEVPQDARLTFSVRTQWPLTFAADEAIEVASADEAFSVTLSQTNGGLRLEDRHVAVAMIEPARVFGPSAFGPLQFRVVQGGAMGDWQPLATLVRLPALAELQCPSSEDRACRLSGADLYLLGDVASDAGFGNPVTIPDGFPGPALPVPHPVNGRLYIRLRDDPSVVHSLELAVRPMPDDDPVTAH